jgi:GT2 family glycosyltransferase
LSGYAKGSANLHVILSPKNLGFSGGNNLALRQAAGRHILLLNSDAYLIDDSLLKAIRFLDSRPTVFACAGMLLTEAGKPGISYGFFPSPWNLAKEVFTWRFAGLRAVIPKPDEPNHEVDFPCGAFFMMNASILQEIGEMDESFFVFFEETDLAKRARDMGYSIIYCNDVRAVHLGGQSTKKTSDNMLEMFYLNWRRYLEKHHGPISSWAARRLLLLFFRAGAFLSRVKKNPVASQYYRNQHKSMEAGWSATAANHD